MDWPEVPAGQCGALTFSAHTKSSGEGKGERGNLLCFPFSGKDAKGGMFILYVACQRAHYRVSDIVFRHMSGVGACSFPLSE